MSGAPPFRSARSLPTWLSPPWATSISANISRNIELHCSFDAITDENHALQQPEMPVVLPGDVVRLPQSSSSSAIRLGPGLLYPNEESRTSQSGLLLATRAGVLGKVNEKGKARDVGGATTRKAQGWWIESRSRRVSR